MDEPSALEIKEKLKAGVPGWTSFDQDIAEHEWVDVGLTRCGLLTALGWKAWEWVGADEQGSLQRALNVIDELLGTTAQLPPGTSSIDFQKNLYNDILTCFVETLFALNPTVVRTTILPLARGERIAAMLNAELNMWEDPSIS